MTNLIDQLLNQAKLDATLIGIAQSGKRRIEVHQHQNKRWIETGGQCIQSTLDIDAPARLVQAYKEVMLTALLLNNAPKKILNLGFGGGAFERFFAAGTVDVNIVSVDADAQLVALAREHFPIPPNWPVVIESAESYLTNSDALFDLILCDLFIGQKHAGCLCLHSFYHDASLRLADTGVMSINLAPTSEAQLITILQMARQVFTGAMLSKVGDYGNVVLLLCKQPLPSFEQLSLRVEPCEDLWPLDFTSLLSGFKLIPH